MDSAETFAKLLKGGLPQFTAAIKAVPADKLDWKPEPTSRSAHELAVEVVTMLPTFAQALTTRTMPEAYIQISSDNAKLTIEALCAEAETQLDALIKAIKAFPVEEYDTVLNLPWGAWTYFEAISYPYWNLMWHTGQINYIQTLYGDTEFR